MDDRPALVEILRLEDAAEVVVVVAVDVDAVCRRL